MTDRLTGAGIPAPVGQYLDRQMDGSGRSRCSFKGWHVTAIATVTELRRLRATTFWCRNPRTGSLLTQQHRPDGQIEASGAGQRPAAAAGGIKGSSQASLVVSSMASLRERARDAQTPKGPVAA